MEKAREFQKNMYFCFIDYAKAFDCVDHNKLWKILKEMGIPDHLMCLLRNLYAGQEARVRTGHGTTDWFQIGKGVRQGCLGYLHSNRKEKLINLILIFNVISKLLLHNSFELYTTSCSIWLLYYCQYFSCGLALLSYHFLFC